MPCPKCNYEPIMVVYSEIVGKEARHWEHSHCLNPKCGISWNEFGLVKE